MNRRKLPEVQSPEAKEFCEQWDSSTHIQKLVLCRKNKISYQQGRDFRCACKVNDLPAEYTIPPHASFEETLALVKGMDSLVATHQRFPTELSISLPTAEPIGIVFTSDWQLGQFGVDYDSFQNDIKTVVNEPGLYCAVGGDGYQNIIQASKIGSAHNQIPICVQKALYVMALQEIIKKLLFIGTGNHNYWSALAEGEDWDAELARRLQKEMGHVVVYTKHFAKVIFRIGNIVYPIVRMHKSRFQSSFNLTHTCKQNQRMYFPDARIVVAEDKHVGDTEQYRYNDQECLAIRTGTYAVYDDYAQQNGFFGSHVCNPTVVLYPNEDRLVGFKDMREAIIYLRAVRK